MSLLKEKELVSGNCNGVAGNGSSDGGSGCGGCADSGSWKNLKERVEWELEIEKRHKGEREEQANEKEGWRFSGFKSH